MTDKYKVIDEFINNIYEFIRLEMLYDSNTKLYDYYVEVASNLYDNIITSYTQYVEKNADKSFSVKGIPMYMNYLLKNDDENTSRLNFLSVTFVKAERTADYTTTKRLIAMLDDGANKEDIISYLNDRAIPGDEITLNNLAEMIMSKRPLQGFLTISNALQWRLQYSRVISLNNKVEGVVNIDFKK